MSLSYEEHDARKDPRFKVRIAIFNGMDEGNLISNYSVNFSTGGVFIETYNVLPEESLLRVTFKLPDSDTIINCKARVAWVNEEGNLRKNGLPPGMGLHFLDLSLENIHAIRDFLNRGDLVPTW
jgi:uncharacterized protein (TIGR02266 family)